MKLYQHDFNSVEDYLHHRPPYLLVDRIVSISSEAVETEHVVGDRDTFLDGHFPGAPIFPGAMMQELATQSAGILIAARYNPMAEFNTHDPDFNEFALGVLSRVDFARYKSFARPGDLLTVRAVLDNHIDGAFDFSANISSGPKTIMQIGFRLINIRSELLTGA